MPSDEGVLEELFKYYDNHQEPLSAEGSYQVTAYIYSWYSSPLVDFPTLQPGFLPKMKIHYLIKPDQEDPAIYSLVLL
jgi:hypothetical protein